MDFQEYRNEKNLFNLEKLEKLIAEQEYAQEHLEDILEELELQKSDQSTALIMGQEYSRAFEMKRQEIFSLQSELRKIEKRQKDAKGKISEKKLKRKTEIEKQIKVAEEEAKVLKQNRDDARAMFKELDAEAKDTPKYKDAQQELEKVEKEISSICEYVQKTIDKFDKEEEEIKANIAQASVNNLDFTAELDKYVEFKNKKEAFYDNYKEVLEVLGYDKTNAKTNDLDKTAEEKGKEELIEENIIDKSKEENTENKGFDVNEKFDLEDLIVQNTGLDVDSIKQDENSEDKGQVDQKKPEDMTKEELLEYQKQIIEKLINSKTPEERRTEAAARRAKMAQLAMERKERDFSDESRIDADYSYITMNNARNLGYDNGMEIKPQEEVVVENEKAQAILNKYKELKDSAKDSISDKFWDSMDNFETKIDRQTSKVKDSFNKFKNSRAIGTVKNVGVLGAGGAMTLFGKIKNGAIKLADMMKKEELKSNDERQGR